MDNLFRTFLDGVSARGPYCLDCLSEMYGEPARTVSRYLSESRSRAASAPAQTAPRRGRPSAPTFPP